MSFQTLSQRERSYWRYEHLFFHILKIIFCMVTKPDPKVYKYMQFSEFTHSLIDNWLLLLRGFSKNECGRDTRPELKNKFPFNTIDTIYFKLWRWSVIQIPKPPEMLFCSLSFLRMQDFQQSTLSLCPRGMTGKK